MWKKEKESRPTDTESEGQESSGFQSSDSSSVGDHPDEVIAFVGKGVEFKGVITYKGTVRIDGLLDGEIHTDGVLLVGDDAILTAKVTAGVVISRGKITGDIIAKEKIRLLSPAILNGSVTAPVISMEEGVLFNGTIEMARAEVRELPRAVAGGQTKR
jgi:cytoskeletal protein CcmA (bactofilin family)